MAESLAASATASPRPTFITPGAVAAIVATTVAGLLQAGIGQPLHLAWLWAAMITAMVLVIIGLGRAERRSNDTLLRAVSVFYGVAVALTVAASEGRAALIAMPFVSVMVLYFSLRTAILVSIAVLAEVVWTTIRTVPDPAETLVPSGAGIFAALAFVLVFSLLARRERYARREVERMAAELELLATTRERNRIAREVHDSLGHYLTAASMQLEAARTTPEAREERISRVQQLLRDGMSELRRAIFILREAPETPQPFAQAMNQLVEQCTEAGLEAHLALHGVARPLPGVLGFTLYRVAQEALTNARKHARAKHVEVSLDYGVRTVTLIVSDDGRGLSAPENANGGSGLSGLKERVQLVGGTLALSSPEGGGLSVRVEVTG